jgi:hypothetical protein
VASRAGGGAAGEAGRHRGNRPNDGRESIEGR